MEKRICGDCKLCCKAVAVGQIAKPTGTWCPDITATGCAIYATRPRECRAFDCMWLKGRFLESDRPDRVNVVFAEDNGLVTACEDAIGDANQQRPKELIQEILQAGTPVVVRNSVEVRNLYPDGQESVAAVDQSDPLRTSVVRGTN